MTSRDFNAKTAEEAFRGVVAQLGIEAGALVHPVRVALTGRAVGPGLFDTMVSFRANEDHPPLERNI